MGISWIGADDLANSITEAELEAIDELVNAVRELEAACLPSKLVTTVSDPRDDLVYFGFSGGKLLPQFLLILRYSGSFGDFFSVANIPFSKNESCPASPATRRRGRLRMKAVRSLVRPLRRDEATRLCMIRSRPA